MCAHKKTRLDLAIDWVKKYTINNEGISISHKQPNIYPEVTGYFIPTLVALGEHKLALNYAHWLISIQRDDGSFPGPSNNGAFTFDTGQVIRGFLALIPKHPEFEAPLRKACDWILQTSTNGRLFVPDSKDWNLGSHGQTNEAVHLYALAPIQQAGELLNEKKYSQFAQNSFKYYLDNCNINVFKASNSMIHFFSYIQEALVEFGFHEDVKKTLIDVMDYQQKMGGISAYADVPWVCLPGQAQLAKIWFMLGDHENGDKALSFMESFQNPSGGFFGSVGVGANYFPDEEVSWAVKYYIDAKLLSIKSYFDSNSYIFPKEIDDKDPRLNALLGGFGDLSHKKILDAGCGKGRFAKKIKRQYPTATLVGLDISKEMLQCLPDDIDGVQGSLTNIPYPDDHFEAVYCIEALEHVRQYKKAIKELCRVLKPMGRIIIIDKNGEKLGAMETPEWEKWFDNQDILNVLSLNHIECQSAYIGYENIRQPDGLFICWFGLKQNVSKEEQNIRTNLSDEQWHHSIIGKATPESIADLVKNHNVPEWTQVMLENTKPGDRLLELGSGTGQMSAYLALHGRDVTLLDFSQDSLDFSKSVFDRLGLKASFINANILEELPFEDDTFHCVWSSGTLEHFSDNEISNIMAESKRVTCHSVISLVPNANSIAYRIGKLYQEKHNLWPWGYEDPKWSMCSFFNKCHFFDIREYSVAAQHSLNFLPDEKSGISKCFQEFFSDLSLDDTQALNQGYLLVTIGYKKERRVLAVVPSDPVDAYIEKGLSEDALASYYNPNNYFDDVYCFSMFNDVVRFVCGMHVIPTSCNDVGYHMSRLGIRYIRAYGGANSCEYIDKAKLSPHITKIVSIHDARSDWLYDSLFNADYVLTISNKTTKIVLDKGIDRNKVFMFSNRVCLNQFSMIKDKKQRQKFRDHYSQKYLILHIGRKQSQKNLDSLLKALACLGKDYGCIAVGIGNESYYKKLAEDLGVDGQYYSVDSINNDKLVAYYSFTDCFCVPSRHEGFGIVFIEALACQSVVVTSNIMPMNEFIRHNETGILVDDFENAQALADSIQNACTNNLLREKIQSNTRSSIEHFDKTAVNRQESEIYGQIQFNRELFGSSREVDILSLYAKYKLTYQKNISFVNIGANCGKVGDPLYQLITTNAWKGLFVEPQKNAFKLLKQHYSKYDELKFDNCAIDDNCGEKDLFVVSFSDERWATGLSSFNENQLRKHIKSGYIAACAKKSNITVPKAQKDWIKTVCVKTKSLKRLFEDHDIVDIDIFSVDTEGHDITIIRQLLSFCDLPELIQFEWVHFSNAELSEIYDLLKQNEYSILNVTESLKKIAIKTAVLDRMHQIKNILL